jgi:hypothetical protein
LHVYSRAAGESVFHNDAVRPHQDAVRRVEVIALVSAALALYTPTACRNYIRHCGYRLTVQL